MREYSVTQLANLAGVSVRTLHHYDSIGLLVPRARTAAGNRIYGKPELLRLQQILFYRELDLSLSAIRRILDSPDFDPVDALENHRARLEARVEGLNRLLHTVDLTLVHYTEKKEMTSDRDLYQGFRQDSVPMNRRAHD